MNKKEIKDYIKQNAFTKPFYKVYKDIKDIPRNRRREKGRKIFIDSGESVMRDVQKIISSCENIEFFFAYGTLLGIIRDGKLLGRDMDLDMVVLLDHDEDINRFRDYVVKKGFKRLHSFSVDGVGINQDAFLYKNIMIDINYAKTNGSKKYNYNFYDLPEEKNKILIFPFTYTRSVKYKFNDFDVNVPENPELYLEETYGKDWRIPNPKYIYWENPQTIKTELTGKIEIINELEFH